MMQTNDKTPKPAAPGDAETGKKRAWVSPRIETIELRNAKTNPVQLNNDGFNSSVH